MQNQIVRVAWKGWSFFLFTNAEAAPGICLGKDVCYYLNFMNGHYLVGISEF